VKLQKAAQRTHEAYGRYRRGHRRLAHTPEDVIPPNVRRACRTYGPGGAFIPSLTYGGPAEHLSERRRNYIHEIEKYNREVYGVGE
jgi:hypothetical protein